MRWLTRLPVWCKSRWYSIDQAWRSVTINYAVQAATAIAGSDFTVFPAGTIGFAPGETVKLVTVGILNDATAEPTEVFDIALTSVIGATVGEGGATFSSTATTVRRSSRPSWISGTC
jgi:hypothetical protein